MSLFIYQRTVSGSWKEGHPSQGLFPLVLQGSPYTGANPQSTCFWEVGIRQGRSAHMVTYTFVYNEPSLANGTSMGSQGLSPSGILHSAVVP